MKLINETFTGKSETLCAQAKCVNMEIHMGNVIGFIFANVKQKKCVGLRDLLSRKIATYIIYCSHIEIEMKISLFARIVCRYYFTFESFDRPLNKK